MRGMKTNSQFKERIEKYLTAQQNLGNTAFKSLYFTKSYCETFLNPILTISSSPGPCDFA